MVAFVKHFSAYVETEESNLLSHVGGDVFYEDKPRVGVAERLQEIRADKILVR